MDLYFVLKNPFSSSEKRIKKYITISIMLAFTLASLGLVLTKNKNYFWSELNYRAYQTIACLNLFVAIFVMVLVMFRFRKKGMNSDIKT